MIALLTGLALADSPLTTTELHRAYLDHPLVAEAAETRELSEEAIDFLARGKRGLGLKAAVINAVSWDIDGTEHGAAFLAAVAKRRDLDVAHIVADPTLLKPQEAFAAGYLLALDDYFQPDAALPFLAHARDRLPRSRTVALVEALVRAQLVMEQDWCAVYEIVDAALTDPSTRPDLSYEAEQIVASYIGLYAPSCPEPEPEPDTDAPDDTPAR